MFSPNGISTILFDLDGTLRHSRPSFNQAFCDFACQLGVTEKVGKRQAAMRWLHYYWAQSTELLADLETFRDQHELFWTHHARHGLVAFGCEQDQIDSLAPELYRRMANEYEPESWVPPDVPEMLQALKESGFRLGVVSNRTHPFDEELNTLGLAPYFDCALAAGAFNAWKPEPDIFHHALEKLDVKAHEALYVGDNYYADVIGAQRAGLRPVLLDPDGLFPEAECQVIQSMSQLAAVLEK